MKRRNRSTKIVAGLAGLGGLGGLVAGIALGLRKGGEDLRDHARNIPDSVEIPWYERVEKFLSNAGEVILEFAGDNIVVVVVGGVVVAYLSYGTYWGKKRKRQTK